MDIKNDRFTLKSNTLSNVFFIKDVRLNSLCISDMFLSKSGDIVTCTKGSLCIFTLDGSGDIGYKNLSYMEDMIVPENTLYFFSNTNIGVTNIKIYSVDINNKEIYHMNNGKNVIFFVVGGKSLVLKKEYLNKATTGNHNFDNIFGIT